MDALDAVLPLVAVAAPTAVVLLDIVSYDRAPAAPAEPPDVAPDVVTDVVAAAGPEPQVEAEPEVVPQAQAAPERETAEPEVVEPVEVAAPDEPVSASMLSGLSTTEADERSWLRRVRSLLIVVVLTLLTAALVGAGIYRAVSRLG